jgi:uncharacterized membrane protein
MRSKSRLEAFSDGVFAIAITLLVLEIVVPHVKGSELLGELWRERPMYLAYFIAFMAIGAAWIEHSALVDALDHIDAVFMRLNLLLLLFVAFLPFPTRLMADYRSDFAGERVAVVFFGIILVVQTLFLLLLADYAERHGLYGRLVEEERKEEVRATYQLLPSIVIYGVAAVIGLFSPYVGLSLYLVTAVYLAIPIKTLRRILRRPGTKATTGADVSAGVDDPDERV